MSVVAVLVADGADIFKETTSPTAVVTSNASVPKAAMSSYTYTPVPITENEGSGTNATTSSSGDTTMNWAGYMATGGTYTSISGSWVVPEVTAGTDPIAADATWIGIGGSKSSDLIQVGTENTVEDGQVVGNTFYEQLPSSAQSIPTVSVNAGDTVTASIKEVSPGQWTVTIEDVTNGESYSNTVTYASSESSAEWIEEAPSDGDGAIMPLDEFGSVAFTDGTTTDNGNVVSITDSNAQVVSMENEAGESLATVSSLSSDGGGFTVTRTDTDSTDDINQSTPFSGGWNRQEPGLDAYHDEWDGGGVYSQRSNNYDPGFSVYGLPMR
jgi:hypothetical protein